MERYGVEEKQALRMQKDEDKKRSTNYNYYTDGIWGMAAGYDLAINSSVLGRDGCVKLIAELARRL